MGHGIDTARDFQLGLEVAWHRLTRVFPALSREMLPEVIRVPLNYTLPDGSVRVWEGVTVPVTADDGLPVGVSSEDSYTTFGPRQAWDHVAEVLEGTRYTVSSAGMIYNRSRWFISVDLDELKDVSQKGERFNLVWSGGLAKNQSPSCDLSHYRAVCANTVAIARDQGTGLFTARLTRRFNTRLDAARSEIERAVGMAAVFNRTLRNLEATPATVDNARDVYAGELVQAGADLRSTRATNLLDGLLATFQRGLGNEGKTRGDVLNGFTQSFGQGPSGSRSTRDPFASWVSSEFGGFSSRKSAFASAISTQTGWDRLTSAGREALADARRNAVTV
jgi:hypothetical protein